MSTVISELCFHTLLLPRNIFITTIEQPSNNGGRNLQMPLTRMGSLYLNRGTENMRATQRVVVEFTHPFPRQPHLSLTSHTSPAAVWVESFLVYDCGTYRGFVARSTTPTTLQWLALLFD